MHVAAAKPPQGTFSAHVNAVGTDFLKPSHGKGKSENKEKKILAKKSSETNQEVVKKFAKEKRAHCRRRNLIT